MCHAHRSTDFGSVQCAFYCTQAFTVLNGTILKNCNGVNLKCSAVLTHSYLKMDWVFDAENRNRHDCDCRRKQGQSRCGKYQSEIIRIPLTDSHEQEQDAKHIDDGHQRHCQRRDDPAERRHAPEEAHNAEGAEDANDARVLFRDEEGQDRHGDDEGVQLAPHVCHKGPEPVR